MDRDRIKQYDDKGIEMNRLVRDYFTLKGIRTKDIIGIARKM